MAKKTKNIQVGNNCLGYIFECGCRMPLSYGVSCAVKKKPIKCPVHDVKWTHKVCMCFECRTIFLTRSTRSIPRCYNCQKETEGLKSWNIYKKNVAKGYVYASKKKKKKPFVDKSRRWECVYGDYCIDRECFRNIAFNCHGCTRFEKKIIEVDFYAKENMEYIYA